MLGKHKPCQEANKASARLCAKLSGTTQALPRTLIKSTRPLHTDRISPSSLLQGHTHTRAFPKNGEGCNISLKNICVGEYVCLCTYMCTHTHMQAQILLREAAKSFAIARASVILSTNDFKPSLKKLRGCTKSLTKIQYKQKYQQSSASTQGNGKCIFLPSVQHPFSSQGHKNGKKLCQAISPASRSPFSFFFSLI